MPIMTPSSKIAAKALTLVLLPLLPTTALADWSGNYGGLSLGQLTNGNIGVNLGEDVFLGFDDQDEEIVGDEVDLSVESDPSLSLFYGYQTQRGDYVFGGEVAYTAATKSEFSIEDFADDTLETDVSFIDVKARAGYSFDNIMVYGVLGVSRASAEVVSGIDLTADGFNFGVGADYMITDQFLVGAEFLGRRLNVDDLAGEGIDTETQADTVAIRGSFKF